MWYDIIWKQTNTVRKEYHTMSKIQEVTQALRNSISQVILGKEDVVDKLLAALLCG